MRNRFSLGSVVALVSLALPSVARADSTACDVGPSYYYQAQALGSTVTVCTGIVGSGTGGSGGGGTGGSGGGGTGSGGSGAGGLDGGSGTGGAGNCGGSTNPMLRQDEATGAVYEVTACDENGCFVDECVPPGTYRYGLATPPQCDCGGGNYIAYFGEVTVANALAPDCVPTSGRPPPVAYSGAPPWGVATGDAGPAAGSTCPSSSSCACRAASTEQKGVLCLQMLAVAAGLLMMRLRRRRGRRTPA